MLDGLELKISKSSNILVLISDPNLTPLPQAELSTWQEFFGALELQKQPIRIL